MKEAFGPNRIAYARIIAALVLKPHSIKQLAEYSGLSAQRTWLFVKVLRRQPYTCFIAAWDEDSRGLPQVPCYQLGKLPDVPRPKPISSAERSRRYRRNRKMRAAEFALGKDLERAMRGIA